MKTTTTTTALESRTQKQARRIDAAHARHTAPTYAPMTAQAGEHPAIYPALHDMTAQQLYHLPELCTALVLRARHRETGMQLFADLAAASKADARIMYDRTDRAQRASDRRAEYETARDTAAMLDSIAERISTDPDIAAAAAEQARDERSRRDAAREDADAMDKADAAATTSERAAMVQAAAARLCDMMQQGADLTAVIPALCKAASAALAELSNPDSMTRNSTVTRWLTIDEWHDIRDRYAIDLTAAPPQHIPAAMTKAGAACYKTVETRDRKAERARLAKHDPATLARKAVTEDEQAICIIYHYRTAAPYVTFNQFAAPENTPELSNNGGINAIFNQSDRDSINALFDRANLTDRERLLCLYACSSTADRRAAAAHRDYMTAAADTIAATDSGHRAQARKRAAAAADKQATAARWQYAFDRLSRTDSGSTYSTQTRDKYRRRICAAITKARTAPTAPTAADKHEHERRYWETMQRNSRRAAAPTTADRADLLTAASRAAAATTPAAPVIHWQTKAQANNRRAHIAAKAAAIAAKSRIDNSTPAAQAAAQRAAQLYAAKQRLAAAKAQQRARAQAAAAHREQMARKGVYSLSTTFTQWQAWTADERAEHMCYLSKRA